MPVKLNEPTRRMTIVDPDRHPAFMRLWGKEGFVRVSEENLQEFSSGAGLVLVFFADDPTTFKETIDMAVIAPEIAKAFGGAVSAKGFSVPAVGRAMASRYGITRLPAAGFFRNGKWLGAVQGLKTWEQYLSGLAEIGSRTDPPKRTVAISAR